MRLQAAVDYLATYGLAIVIVTAAIVLIYFYAGGQLLSQPAGCYFPTEVRCSEIAVGANSLASAMQLVLVNGQKYPVKNPTIVVNMSGYGSYNGLCRPSFVLPGGIILCSINNTADLTMPALAINQQAKGFLLFNESLCPSIGTSACQTRYQESYNGTYTAVVGPTPPTIACTISVAAGSSSAGIGTDDLVEANVLFSGVPVSGVTINFTADTGSHAGFSNEYALTNPNGTAYTYVTDSQAETVTVTGNFITGCLGASGVTFS